MTAAQKVRLWFAGGTQLLAFVFLFAIFAEPNNPNYQLADGSTGSLVSGETITNTSLFGFAVFLFLFQVAAVVLASISLYRFTHPLAKSYTPGANSYTPGAYFQEQQGYVPPGYAHPAAGYPAAGPAPQQGFPPNQGD